MGVWVYGCRTGEYHHRCQEIGLTVWRDPNWCVELLLTRSAFSCLLSSDGSLPHSPGSLPGSAVDASGWVRTWLGLLARVAGRAGWRAFDGHGVVFRLDAGQVVGSTAEGPDDAGPSPISGEGQHGVLAVSAEFGDPLDQEGNRDFP